MATVTKTANELFLDAMIRHQIYLMRFSGSVKKKIEQLLNATEKDLAAKIKSMLQDVDNGSPLAIRRLEQLEKWIKNTRTKTWDQIDEVWVQNMTDLAKQEPTFVAVAMQTSAPVILDLAIPTASQLKSIVLSQPFQGKTLRDWSSTIKKQDIDRITSQIKIGMVQGETSDQIARRVVGTAQLQGADGVTEISRTQAAALTRTAVNFISNEAKRDFYQENDDIIDEELFVATLDAKTTAVCRAEDGKRYPVGEGPIPPLHWNCRSLRVAIMNGEVLGNRPSKPVTDQQLLREYADENDLDPVTSRDDLPYGTKTDFDEFARNRINELTGTVPASQTYQEWLTNQSATFQDDVLGQTKGKLFRDGGLTLDKYVNRNGDELTLSELATKHADAFKAAGLDPNDF